MSEPSEVSPEPDARRKPYHQFDPDERVRRGTTSPEWFAEVEAVELLFGHGASSFTSTSCSGRIGSAHS